MTIDFSKVKKLRDADIKEGQRWIYATDLNIKHKDKKLKSTERLDCEIEDIKYILDRKGIVLILGHKGRFSDGDTEDLDFVCPYLSEKLGVEVKYFPNNATMPCVDFAKSLPAGNCVVMGNVRKNMTEDKNDLGLASQYAKMADCIAVGGFGKAHRAESSNVGVLEFLPGYITESQIKEMKLLKHWAGKNEETYSIAILGGVKKEKIKTGLIGFFKTYDYIIPGGIVLNTLLKCKGYDIGDSIITDSGKSFEKYVMPILSDPMCGKVFLPNEVIIAKNITGKFTDFEDIKTINIKDGVPKGYAIVDYIISSSAISALEWCVKQKGRMILAGTPGVYTAGFKDATDKVMNYMNNPDVKGIVLGGDTAAEVKFNGPSSTGGGSALSFVANGTTEVFEALIKNKEKFN